MQKQWVLPVAPSNHDDEGNTNPTNLHIWQWKTVFLHAGFARAFFIFWHFEDVLVLSMTWNELLLQLCGRREQMMTNVQFCLLISQALVSIYSRIVKAHFSGIMTLNRWKMVTETRSDIFRWRFRFRRRRVCLSFLLILPYARPPGPGLIWQTIWLAIEARHFMEPASWELISYQYSIPTFLFSRTIAVRQLTFVVIPDNIFWNSCIPYMNWCYVLQPLRVLCD